MTFVKSTAGLIPGFMALGVLGKSVQMVPKNWGPKGVKKVKPLPMVKGFTQIMIGVPMIGATAGMISKL